MTNFYQKNGLSFFNKTNNQLFSGIFSEKGIEGNFINGKMEGLWKFNTKIMKENEEFLKECFSFTHSIIYEGFYLPGHDDRKNYLININYKNGLIHGLKQFYSFPEKKLLNSVKYNEDKIIENKIFDHNEQIIIVKNYTTDEFGHFMSDGEIKCFDNENKRFFFSGTYSNDVKEGLWEFYHYNLSNISLDPILENNSSESLIKDFIYKFVQSHRSDTTYDWNKENYKNGKKHGLFESFFESGQVKQKFQYKQNMRSGLCETYYENGKLKERENYKDDKLNGISEEFWENGKLKFKNNFINDFLDGLYEVFDEKGTLRSKRFYKMGKKDGLSEQYYENGNLWNKGFYKNDYQDGIWVSYNEDGSLKSKKEKNSNKSWIKEQKMLNLSRQYSDEISDVMGGSEFMSDDEKDVFGE